MLDYGTVTDVELDVPTSFAAVTLSDCSRLTGLALELLLCNVNGIATAKLPPKPWDALLWNQAVAAALTAIGTLDADKLVPAAGTN